MEISLEPYDKVTRFFHPNTCNSMRPVVEFDRVMGEIQRSLHLNDHTQRFICYIVRRFGAESSKIGHFQILEAILEANIDIIFQYTISLPN